MPQFGDYELLSEVARGGMGVVYKARQRGLGRLVAVKLILAGQLATRESVERFRLEAQTAAQLHHPGIVQIYEIGEYETQHFFSMELIDGVSLAECIGEFTVHSNSSPAERRQQEEGIAELIAKVARALEFAHQRGVLHRDVKPSNILIDQHGQPKLTDFGLAKLAGSDQNGLTLSNTLLGSPSYLAPEQAAGKWNEVTSAADVYGLGATLYELLTGRPPFVGSNAAETMWMAINQPVVAPRQLNPVVDRDLETIAMRCLEKRPGQRYASAAAVADELERFLRREPIQARPVGAAEQLWRWCQRNPGWATMSMALLLAIVIGGGVAAWQWLRAEQANLTLTESLSQLEWEAIDSMLEGGQSSRALAKVASLLRENPRDWKAAMFGMSIMEQRRFPIPAAPLIRHPDAAELTAARLSPDGTRVVTASKDKTARLWNSKTAESLLPPLAHEGVVNWAEFSPDGSLVATCSDDKTVRLWSVESGTARGEPMRHDEPVLRVHFSPEDRWLMSRTQTLVSIREVATGRVVIGPLRHAGRIVKAKFLPNGQQFFTVQQAGEKSALQVWDLEIAVNNTTPETLEPRLRVATGPLVDADITADLTRVVSIVGKQGHIWNAATGEMQREFASLNGRMIGVAFSPDAERIAAIGFDQWIRVWDAGSAAPLTPELPHDYLLSGFGFVGNGDRVMSWGDDSLAQVWDSRTGEPFVEPMRHANRVAYAEAGRIDDREIFLTTLSHNNRNTAAAGAGTGAIQLWRAHDKLPLLDRSRKANHYGHDGCRLNADGKLLALGTITQEVWISRTDTGEDVLGPLRTEGAPWGVLFTPNSRRLVTTTSSGQVTVWSLESGQPIAEPVRVKAIIQPADMTRDGLFFATGSTDGFVRIWSSATGQIVWEQKHGSEINSVAFSPDGRTLASAGEDRIARVWEVASGKLAQELNGHKNEVMRVNFGPDNRSLITASQDFTARIWDVPSGRTKFTLTHQGEVLDAAFSPDGRFVATASRDRSAILWDASTGKPHRRNLFHPQGVRALQFTSDSRRLMTLDFLGPRIWDVETGHPLTVRLPHRMHGGTGFQSVSCSPQLSADGETIFIATDSGQALLWQVPVPPDTIPTWFPDLLESVAGQRFLPGTDTSIIVPPSKFLDLQTQLRTQRGDDDYTRWANEWLSR